jgi:hypothetical protein
MTARPPATCRIVDPTLPPVTVSRSLMKLQFKHQKFQADAAKAVVDETEKQPRI